MTLPRTLAPEWASSMRSPWDTVNKALRIHDAFATHAVIQDRDLTAPPGSCADGDAYLVADAATGDWYGEDGRLAIAVGTDASNGWHFCNIGIEGNELWVVDEQILIRYVNSVWAADVNSLQFDLTAGVDDGDVLIYEASSATFYPGPQSAADAAAQDLVLIEEVVTTGSQATVSFTGIAATYRDLIAVVRGRGDTAAGSVVVRIQFNADTATNYAFERYNEFGTTGGDTQSYIELGSLPAASAPSGYAGTLRAHIPNYRDATFHREAECRSAIRTAAATIFWQTSYGWWENAAAAINQVVVSLSAGNFVNGSVVSLYGVK